MFSIVAFCRDEATRTPDPYVPNVVRYQLRYIPIAFPNTDINNNAVLLKCGAKILHFFETKLFFQRNIIINLSD